MWHTGLAAPQALPRPGIEPVSPAVTGRLFTNQPPGKPGTVVFNSIHMKQMYTVIMCTGVTDGKESSCNAGDLGLIPGLGRSPEEGNGSPLATHGILA